MTAYNNFNGDGANPFQNELPEEELESVVEAARIYASCGLCVVPNQPESKRPAEKGWPELRLGVEDVPRYFSDSQNVGLLLGEPSHWLVAVDLDCTEAIAVADRFLPVTLSSGRRSAPRSHRFFVSPGAKSRSWKTPGKDGTMLAEVRSTKAQTLVEPSIHPTGERYEWDREGILEAVETPAEQLELLCTKIATAAAIARDLPDGGRHHLAMALAGYVLRPGRLDEDTTLEILLAAWAAAGAREAVEDLRRIVRDTAKKISSGDAVTGGPTLEEMAPGLPSLLARWWGWDSEDGAGASGAGAEDEDIPTDDELRDEFVAANPHHAFGLGEWKRYESGVWCPVPEFLVKRQIVRVLEAAKPEGVRPTSGRLSSVHELARVELAVSDETWDADPDILVCGNGTLHIPTGELLPHSPEHYATSAVPYDYDENAVAPTWEHFLKDFVDASTARFLQEFAGYALTTDVSHEIALWLCGPPGGGRSTFIAGLEAMLGQRAGVLGLGEIERSRFALADVPGKTLLTATEQPAGFMKASDVLNALISGDKRKVEKKYKDAFDLYSKAKLVWAMNDVPRLPSANDGLFRRVKVVEIDPIPESERDPGIKEVIKVEGAGILVWALEGLRRLRQRGRFEIPETVRAATEEFRLTNDVPAMFVQEACLTSEDCEEQADTLRKACRHWCLEHGYHPMSARRLAKEWKRLGFGERNLHGRKVYKGLKVDPGWIGAQENYPRSR
jgi:P4 family phage/plasmid primase-like protien